MTAPTFAPVDEDTADLLSLVADLEHPVGRDAVAAFLTACETDARDHDGIVSVNRVSAALTDRGLLGDGPNSLDPHRYSSLWSACTGRGKPMRKATPADIPNPWEIRKGSTSGNNGKPMKLRVWNGAHHTTNQQGELS